MIKKIFSIAIVAISVIAAPMSASAKDNNSIKGDAQTTEIRIEKKAAERQARIAERESKEFEGIALSETQKKQLADLKEKTRSEMKKIKEKSAADNKEVKEMSKKVRESRKAQAKENRRAYLKEIKEIIGNDNYVVFLENQYVNHIDKTPKHHVQGKKSKGDFTDRGGKNGKGGKSYGKRAKDKGGKRAA